MRTRHLIFHLNLPFIFTWTHPFSLQSTWNSKNDNIWIWINRLIIGLWIEVTKLLKVCLIKWICVWVLAKTDARNVVFQVSVDRDIIHNWWLWAQNRLNNKLRMWIQFFILRINLLPILIILLSHLAWSELACSLRWASN